MNEEKKLLILICLVIGLFLISRFTSLRDYIDITYIRGIKEWTEKYPYKGALLFITSSCFLVIAGIPKAIICTAAGVMFGFWKGLLLASIGIVLGSFIIFIIARLLGAPFFYKRLRKYIKLIERHRENQLIMVLVIKQLPIPCFLNNALLGLAPISIPIFIIGCALGQLPSNIVFTLYGSSVHGDTLLKISIATLIALLLFVAVKYLVSRYKL